MGGSGFESRQPSRAVALYRQRMFPTPVSLAGAVDRRLLLG